MKKIILSASLLLLLNACNVFKYSGRGDLAVENFKTVLPFQMLKDMAIAVPIKIGAGTSYFFHFDTHAAESAYNAGSLSGNKHVTFLGSSNLKISTTSGEKIDRRYYNADSVIIGNVLVTNASLLRIDENRDKKDTVYPNMDGILGLSLLRKGIWKIDFENNTLTFASSMDSLRDISDKIKFAESSVFDIFSAQVQLDGVKEKVAVDFGTNAGIFLPLNDMEKMNNFSNAEVSTSTKKTAAGISSETAYRLLNERVSVNGHSFNVRVIGSKNQTEAVIGLSFFKQFRYVILDYPNGIMYISGTTKA
ncbi:MAG: hypothetical protein BGO70_02355 [Bacteroidetes bacterium 43-93]|nr:hypothetical protein [Bacteroidota bacterium]OJW99139.1 MAG: hypothetical protein BGO70_02355 [Bacteroidetes bacterium 43-93]